MAERREVLNIGVIGAGWWATYSHLPGILDHPAARLVAVHSRDQDKADKIARDFKATHAFTDYRELVHLEDLDAVVISSTPNVHYEQAIYALEHDKDVLVEKPMTFTAREARELCELAADRKLELLISCPWHYTTHALEARRLVCSGQLGEIRMISILMTNPIDKLLKGINTKPTHGEGQAYIEPKAGSYNDPAIAGGGQIFCQVSHAAAYISFLTGLQPAEVFARFDYAGSVNDIYDALTITLENGALVSIASTAATPLSERNYEVRVFGTEAILQMELWKGNMTLIPFEGERTLYPDLPSGEIYPDRGPVTNFIDACLGLAPNGSEGTIGLASMEVIEAACRSNRLNRPVPVSELTYPPEYDL